VKIFIEGELFHDKRTSLAFEEKLLVNFSGTEK
jgi:hypothetical protein